MLFFWGVLIPLLMVLFITTIYLVFLSFRNEKRFFHKKLIQKETTSLLIGAWIGYWFTIFACSIPYMPLLGFLEKGSGGMLLEYLLPGTYEFVTIPGSFSIGAAFYLIILIFPWLLILFKGLSYLLSRLYGERIPQKNLLGEKVSLIFIGNVCMILSITTLSCIIISLFLPWIDFNNFITFLFSNFNLKTMGLFVSLFFGIGFIIISAIFIIKFLISQFSGYRTKIDFEEKPKPRQNWFIYKKIIFRWFLSWMGGWITLSISKAYLLILINEELLNPTIGLLLYLSTAQYVVMIGIIMGLIVVSVYILYSEVRSKMSLLDV